MKTRVVFAVLGVLFFQIAVAATGGSDQGSLVPKVGDKVVSKITVIDGNGHLDCSGIVTAEITEVLKSYKDSGLDYDRVTIHSTIKPVNSDSCTMPGDLTETDDIIRPDEVFANCTSATIGGKIETISTPAGVFQACKAKDDNGGTGWVSDRIPIFGTVHSIIRLPFDAVEIETQELLSYYKQP